MKIKDLNKFKVSKRELEAYVKEHQETFEKIIAQDKFLNQIANAFVVIEREDIRVSDLVMHSKTYYSNFEKLDQEAFIAECGSKGLEVGLTGSLWMARVWVRDAVPVGEVKIYGEDDKKMKRAFPNVLLLKEAFPGIVAAKKKLNLK